jgi:hypothetical protein
LGWKKQISADVPFTFDKTKPVHAGPEGIPGKFTYCFPAIWRAEKVADILPDLRHFLNKDSISTPIISICSMFTGLI